ncbi:13737_t:CDS:2 [Racocetra fulgida]|uniref:13737_t:CDS:1 n=1 Tax=Racocetra fulgida TaxID=60492 RepID=A0A9N9DED0_9GLOM|nr:13737_t:CDS:2 [Racocetra fulgida]
MLKTNNSEIAIIVNKVKDEYNHMLSQDIIEFEDGKKFTDQIIEDLINLLEEFVEIDSDKSSDPEESLYDNTSDKENYDSVTAVQIQNPKKHRSKVWKHWPLAEEL